ncbi:protein involved in sulfur oxidation DsrS [Thioploca ingrica]|uniref:Protein involved in sulfur oxidation DsrS n=1 Tax=Thioploca ingrica TaxID=40754 RepID=A0A090AJV5_9GAMM|nr:protein involved in sulfur oxidation DsrS [Thioploca ingrica]
MEQLTPEDNLRLNVLLANQIQAIRIDEAKMVVYGLSAKGDAKVQLHPNCRDEIYLRYVRELISGQILGSPGGYPTYLKRWNRMGQAKSDNLAQLLLLGEPEAVVAVVHAPGLTPELARRAWWALPNSDNARSLLTHSQIAHSEFGQILAHYLVEYLPFEEEAYLIIESVRLVLQPNLIDEVTRQTLWKKGRSKNAYLVGFLWAQPDNLPNLVAARADTSQIKATLAPLVVKENQLAIQLVKVTSSTGQSFLATSEQVLRKPVNQEVVNILFEVMANYFARIRPQSYDDEMNILSLIERAHHGCDTCLDTTSIEQREILALMPKLRETITAMLILSGLGYSILRPIFSHTTAVGSLMRKKLAPVIDPILEQIAILQRHSE